MKEYGGNTSNLDLTPYFLRFPMDDLNSDQIIRPEIFGCLPTSSEGLAVLGNRAYVVIDGDAGQVDSTGVCGTPSGFMVLSLPSPQFAFN